MDTLIFALAGLPALIALFCIVDRLAGGPGKFALSPDIELNIFYWILLWVAIDPATHGALHWILTSLQSSVVGGFRAQAVSAVGAQPVVLQGIELVVVGDFLQYWWHRFMHTRIAWRFHAIHHSTVDMTWLASVRHHPIENIVSGIVTSVPLYLMGFRFAVLAWWPFVAMGIDWLAHANLSWDFGLFRWVVASPAYHRWHHAIEPVDKNFAQVFPVWDRLFGTAWLPAGEVPPAYGVVSNDVPVTVHGQLLYPIVKS